MENGYWSEPNGGSAVFGVMTTRSFGTVTLKEAGAADPVYSTEIIGGVFSFPELPAMAGTLELVYTDPGSETLTRYVTKDQSQYYVQFDSSALISDESSWLYEFDQIEADGWFSNTFENTAVSLLMSAYACSMSKLRV